MGGQRTRPSREAWDVAMDRLLVEHQVHGEMPWHVLVVVGHELGVAPSSVATRYGCFLRRLELAHEAVMLNETERDAIRGTATLGAAHRVLVACGRLTPFVLFERVVWRDGGDRDLVELRKAEVHRRARNAQEAASCAMCRTATNAETAA